MKTTQTQAAKPSLDHKVGRATPCAPKINNTETARRGLTRPTSSRSTFVLLLTILLLTTASLQLLCPASAHAQGGVPLWTNRYNGSANGDDDAQAITVDRDGNVFVTGLSINGQSNWGFVTIKYSNTGAPLWTNLYDGGGSDYAKGIAVNSTGNVFVTGYSYSSNDSDEDYATIAYSNSGIPLWTNRYDGPANFQDLATALAVDAAGNVIVTGKSANSSSDRGYATIAYSNSGVPLWTNRYEGGSSLSELAGIAVDGNDNVFVLAQSAIGFDLATADYTTIAYSSAGDLRWINTYNGPGNSADFPAAITVHSNGTVFVTGSSTSDNFGVDYATIAYSDEGTPLWTNRYDGGGGDFANAIAVDGNGNVFVTGASYNSAPNKDFATIKCSAAGVRLWTRRYSGPSNSEDAAYAIALDSSGNLFVAGSSGPPGPSFTLDFATFAYSNSGVPLWTNRYNGGFEDYVRRIAVDRSGNVFIAGNSYRQEGDSDLVVIKYSSSVPPPRLDFQTLNNQLVLSWTNAGFHLQTAPAVTGPFTNLPAATSPYTNPLTAPQQFFRLIGN